MILDRSCKTEEQECWEPRSFFFFVQQDELFRGRRLQKIKATPHRRRQAHPGDTAILSAYGVQCCVLKGLKYSVPSYCTKV